MAYDNKYKNYRYDLEFLLKEKALIAKQERNNVIDERDKAYKIGHLITYYEVISQMNQQADAFLIDQKEIGLSDLKPDEELL